MAKAAGYILRVAPDRREVLLEAIEGQDDQDLVAEAEADFQHSRNVPLICFACFEPGMVTHLASARRGMRAATHLRRLNLMGTVKLPKAIRFEAIIEIVEPRYRQRLRALFRSGGLVPPSTFLALADAVRELSPTSRSILAHFSRSRSDLIARLPSGAKQSLANQKEAIATALALAKLDRRVLQGWEPTKKGIPKSFLDGLPELRMLEDQMIINDMEHVPGFSLVRKQKCAAAVFEDEDTRLTVVLANRFKLENQLGADLIYYNETFGAFVIVQYKAMEPLGEGRFVFRLPSTLLAKEIKRMDKVLGQLRRLPLANQRASFRLIENPFFLKLCPRIDFNPDNAGLVHGMYLPLDYWRLIESDKKLKGARGGRGVTFENVDRHIENTEFISMVAKSWVGTTQLQSKYLEPILRMIVSTGRTVVIAVKTDK